MPTGISHPPGVHVCKKRIDLGFTELEIYDRFFVGRTRRGVEIDMEKHQLVMDIITREIPAPFGMILDEVNPYSVDFEVMLSLRNDPRAICGAVVTYRFVTLKSLAVPASLVKKPMKFCKTLEEAREWVAEKLASLEQREAQVDLA